MSTRRRPQPHFDTAAPEIAAAAGSRRRRRKRRADLSVPALVAGTGIAFVAGFAVQGRLASASGSGSPNRLVSQTADADPQVGYAAAGSRTASRAHDDKSDNGGGDDPTSARQTFETVYELVHEHYVDPLPSDTVMSYGAARAMLKQLGDPNCLFLEPSQRTLWEDETHGRYAGIGAALYVRSIPRGGYSDSKIVVVSALPGSPAARAGLRTGDIITHIDGRWVLGADPYLRYNKLVQKAEEKGGGNAADDAAIQQEEDRARQKVAGGIGLVPAQFGLHGDLSAFTRLGLPTDHVTLTVVRSGAASPVTLTIPLSRAIDEPAAEVAPLTSRTLTGGVGYIRVPAFTDRTGEQFRDALSTLKGATGLILDLRGNAGGAGGGFPVALDAAEAVASELNGGSGANFGTEIEAEGHRTTLRAPSIHGDGGAGFAPGNVVVLVDRGTAASAEALAASLADRGIATLEGTRTFGDPYVQTLVRLPDDSAYTLTTGRLSGPKTNWTSTGLAPAVLVAANASEEVVLESALHTLHVGRIARGAQSRPHG